MRHLLLAVPLLLASCVGAAQSVCHREAVQRLGCCPFCQDDCGKDPSTAREIDACVEALDPFDESEDAPPESVEGEQELPPEEPGEPEGGDDLEPSLPDVPGD